MVISLSLWSSSSFLVCYGFVVVLRVLFVSFLSIFCCGFVCVFLLGVLRLFVVLSCFVLRSFFLNVDVVLSMCIDLRWLFFFLIRRLLLYLLCLCLVRCLRRRLRLVCRGRLVLLLRVHRCRVPPCSSSSVSPRFLFSSPPSFLRCLLQRRLCRVIVRRGRLRLLLLFQCFLHVRVFLCLLPCRSLRRRRLLISRRRVRLLFVRTVRRVSSVGLVCVIVFGFAVNVFV